MKVLNRDTLHIFKRLLAFAWPHRRYFILSALLLPLSAALQLAQPYTIKVVIDRFISQNDASGVLVGGLFYLGLFLFEGVSNYFYMVAINLGSQQALRAMRQTLFGHIMSLPNRYFDNRPVGRLVSRVTNDIESLNELFVSGVVALLKDLILLIAIVILLLKLHTQLAFFTFLVIPPLVLIGSRLQRVMRFAYKEVRRCVAQINGTLSESVSGIAIIKLFQREQRNLEEFEALNRRHMQQAFKAIRADATLFALVEAFGSVTLAAILWFGAGMMGVGSGSGVLANTAFGPTEALTFGTLVAFIEYLNRFFTPLRDLSGKISILQMAVVAGERIVEVLDETPEPCCNANAGQQAELATRIQRGTRFGVHFERVTLNYQPDKPVLQGIDLEVAPGEKIAIVGPTGGGKTSLVRLLLRLYAYSEGSITLSIDGYPLPLNAIPIALLRGRLVGMVPQDVFTFDGTATENVVLENGPIDAAKHQKVCTIFERLGITHHFAAEDHFGEKGVRLSAGQRQLLALARVLYFDPRILILDEATSAIDSQTERDILRGMELVMENRTSLVIAHRLTTVQSADRTVVISKGRVTAVGSHQQLMQSSEIYNALVTESSLVT